MVGSKTPVPPESPKTTNDAKDGKVSTGAKVNVRIKMIKNDCEGDS